MTGFSLIHLCLLKNVIPHCIDIKPNENEYRGITESTAFYLVSTSKKYSLFHYYIA